ncbi:MAG: hypothetical protein H0W70_13455, partial [Actinobacteria bacterium]|nr:hypothetical protein [Actinomycetota bacterium]
MNRPRVPALSAVTAVDQLHGYALVVLAPEIGRGLGMAGNDVAALAL